MLMVMVKTTTSGTNIIWLKHFQHKGHQLDLVQMLLLLSGLPTHPGPIDNSNDGSVTYNTMTIDSINITSLSIALSSAFINGSIPNLTFMQEISVSLNNLGDTYGQTRQLGLKALYSGPDPELNHTTSGVGVIGPNNLPCKDSNQLPLNSRAWSRMAGLC